LPFSDTGAKEGFSPPKIGCTRRSMKKAEALLGDSSAILRFGDDEALGGDVDGDLQFRW